MPTVVKQHQKNIIVIGSGFGGLSAAVRLAAAGHRVTIFEKRDQLGGRGYQYQLHGFKFDGGPTVITASYMFDEVFAATLEEKARALVPQGILFGFHGEYFGA